MTWVFSTEGKPRPKGSLKCMGATGRGRHHMEEDNPESKPWKLKMIRDIRRGVGIEPIKNGNRVIGWQLLDPFNGSRQHWAPYAGPVEVWASFVFERRIGVDGQVWESHTGEHPDAEDIGDTDKLCRNVGDALEQSGLILNDRQIVSWPQRPGKRWAQPGERAHVQVLVQTL